MINAERGRLRIELLNEEVMRTSTTECEALPGMRL